MGDLGERTQAVPTPASAKLAPERNAAASIVKAAGYPLYQRLALYRPLRCPRPIFLARLERASAYFGATMG